MRIAFVLPTLRSGGAQRVAVTLLRNLDPARYSVELVLLRATGPLLKTLPSDLSVRDLEAAKVSTSLLKLRKALQDSAPDIVFSTMGHVSVAVALVAQTLRHPPALVFREQNLPSADLAANRFSAILKSAYRILYPRADALLCQSCAIKSELERDFGLNISQLNVLRNPVEVDALRKLAGDPVREPGNGARFVAAGRLVHQKGFDLMLYALAKSSTDAHLTILGDGPERSNLQALTSDLGLTKRVAFLGYVDNPWAYFAGADAMLMTSRWEGMPNAALEALACGTPVVATPDCGGLTEIARGATAAPVTIAAIGGEFETVLAQIKPSKITKLRPSVLPEEFYVDQVMAGFEEILEVCAHRHQKI